MTNTTVASWLRTLSIVVATAAIASGQKPVIDCAAQNPQTGDLTVFFGYVSNNNPPVTIPLGQGLQNVVMVSPNVNAILSGTVPSDFTKNTEHMLFSVRFAAAATITWYLNGQMATADAQSVASTPCQLPVGAQLPGYAHARCWDRNANLKCDLAEDVDQDGFCTILDCGGAPGGQGTAGATGPRGAAGAAGIAGTAPLFQTLTTSSGSANAAVSCGATQFLVTGGGACTVPNLPTMGRVASSLASSDGIGWSVSCSTGQATAVAVCAPKP